MAKVINKNLIPSRYVVEMGGWMVFDSVDGVTAALRARELSLGVLEGAYVIKEELDLAGHVYANYIKESPTLSVGTEPIGTLEEVRAALEDEPEKEEADGRHL